MRRDWADKSSFNGNAGRLREDIDIAEGRRAPETCIGTEDWLADAIEAAIDSEGVIFGDMDAVCALAAASASAFAAAAAAASAAAFSSSCIRCCSFFRSLCRMDIARIYVRGQR